MRTLIHDTLARFLKTEANRDGENNDVELEDLQNFCVMVLNKVKGAQIVRCAHFAKPKLKQGHLTKQRKSGKSKHSWQNLPILAAI